jgi:hypothetical protein
MTGRGSKNRPLHSRLPSISSGWTQDEDGERRRRIRQHRMQRARPRTIKLVLLDGPPVAGIAQRGIADLVLQFAGAIAENCIACRMLPLRAGAAGQIKRELRLVAAVDTEGQVAAI